MCSTREQIIKERKLQAKHIDHLNRWLEQEGYDFEVLNYSGCDFMGTEEDNKKIVRTIQFTANELQEYIDNPEKFDALGCPMSI